MEPSSNKDKNVSRTSGLPAYLAVLFLIQFIITMVILFTDQNLQTDFGTVPKYFIHWYGLLVTGVVDIIAFIVLLAVRKRSIVGVGVGWGVFVAAFQVADIATYSTLNIGFSAGSFAQYLFGVTKFSGALPYIPGLYDLLFALYIVAIGVGLFIRSKMKP
ncbi:MAG: hypothetical protein B2I17_01590 [Thermoplasmatales archaeon B_DKE]|nr:MAG: hypothetical protein B2I17_01590 [Thermoplasmatales archaeon B_DKE]